MLQTLHYNETEVDKSQNTKEQSIDEVEELYTLLSRVKDLHPEIEAVSSGAILSNYQRNRVENVYVNQVHFQLEIYFFQVAQD